MQDSGRRLRVRRGRVGPRLPLLWPCKAFTSLVPRVDRPLRAARVRRPSVLRESARTRYRPAVHLGVLDGDCIADGPYCASDTSWLQRWPRYAWRPRAALRPRPRSIAETPGRWLRVSVPLVSHLAVRPMRFEDIGDARRRNHVDAASRTDIVSETPRRSVAKYAFTTWGGRTTVCTGPLLTDSHPLTLIPYFLTAGHCIANQFMASSMEFYWFFERTACGATSVRTERTTGGATSVHRPTGDLKNSAAGRVRDFSDSRTCAAMTHSAGAP